MSLQTIEGIVLQKIDYSESSLIIKILTKEDGIQSFIFQGAKRKNKKGNLISPLAVISLSFYQRNDSQLGKISSVEPAIVYRSIPFDPYKSSILFFMNEVLNKVIKEKEPNAELYTFLRSILEILDLSDNTGNFPIRFLYELTKYLGFYPQIEDGGLYFDLQEGKFVKYLPNHPFYLNQEKSSILKGISGTKFDGSNESKIPLEARRELVYDLLKYYQVIIDNFDEVQSVSVLEATFHD